MKTTCDAFRQYDEEAMWTAKIEMRKTRGLPAYCWKDGRDLTRTECCATCDCCSARA